MSNDTYADAMARVDAVVAGKTKRAKMAPSTPKRRPVKNPRECCSCSAVLNYELRMGGRTRCAPCQIDRAGDFGRMVDGDPTVGLKGEDALGAKPVGMSRPGPWSIGLGYTVEIPGQRVAHRRSHLGAGVAVGRSDKAAPLPPDSGPRRPW